MIVYISLILTFNVYSKKRITMKIGFVGTGKLGLPVSLIYASKGHSLYCYDTNPALYDSSRPITSHLFEEERDPDNNGSLQEWVKDKTLDIRFTNLVEITSTCDIVFVAVQTPHNARYEGSTRIPEERVDFDYTYLKSALQEVSSACTHDVTVVIISTVLPGTVRREILPLLSSHVKLCYNPYFIAMGTVAYDCIHPEFILLGNHDEGAKEKVIEFYKTICDAPVFSTTIENAELIKVTYNTFITTKTVLANTIMELCTYLPNTNCDEVVRALSMATNRIISPSYLKGGMGDGGGCHPRDNIALSWLSRELGLKYDLYDAIMTAREKHCEFLADVIEKHHKQSSLPVCLLGKSFKPNTAITVGSSAVLLGNILTERNIPYIFHDPHISKDEVPKTECVFCVTCAHSKFHEYKLPSNSIVIDPHRSFSAIANDSLYVPIGC